MTGTRWETGMSNWTLSVRWRNQDLHSGRKTPPPPSCKQNKQLWLTLEGTAVHWWKGLHTAISEHTSFCGYDVTFFSTYFSFAYEMCRRKISYLKRKGGRKKNMGRGGEKEGRGGGRTQMRRWSDQASCLQKFTIQSFKTAISFVKIMLINVRHWSCWIQRAEYKEERKDRELAINGCYGHTCWYGPG